MNSPQPFQSRRLLRLGSAVVIASTVLACATAGPKAATFDSQLTGLVVMNVFYRDVNGACAETVLDNSKKARESNNDRVRLMLHNQCNDGVDVTLAFDQEFSCDAPSNPYSFTLAGNTTRSIECSLDYDLTSDGDYDVMLKERTLREANPRANVLLASEIALEAVP